MSAALAIFAKTKGLSPVKTRLAADIGTDLAEAFYDLSVAATAEMALATQQQSHNAVEPYWALAESHAIDAPQWQMLNTLWTGDGDFGLRLHRVYSTLLTTHEQVVLIGTDSPQLEPERITSALLQLKMQLKMQPKTCVIGPCVDGGFYLFAANTAIPQSVWTQVTYSSESTLRELVSNLKNVGMAVVLLASDGDVDTADDLKPLMQALQLKHGLRPQQQRLYDWLTEQPACLKS